MPVERRDQLARITDSEHRSVSSLIAAFLDARLKNQGREDA